MKNGKPIKFSSILKDPLIFIAFGFGSGLSPVAPGTIGTIMAFPLYWILSGVMSNEVFLCVVFAFYVLGIYFCDKAGEFSGEADHSGIVWDEIVAMLLILILVPQSFWSFIVAFVIFRFFDIMKPWPIYIFDRKFKSGFGVMFDDLLAAIYTLIFFYLSIGITLIIIGRSNASFSTFNVFHIGMFSSSFFLWWSACCYFSNNIRCIRS